MLGGARALLFPIAWPEPFGLVMIESMACGTPVIAFRLGSVPEVMVDGVTGFIVEDVAGAVAAIESIETIDRLACRRHFEQHFSAERMAQGYVNLYRRLLLQHLDAANDGPRARRAQRRATGRWQIAEPEVGLGMEGHG